MLPTPLAHVVIGLSGGVDSAVAAWLLKRAGHRVTGVFMKNWEEDDDAEHCTSRQDFLDAAAVADVIGIELEHVNFSAEYKDRVFAAFLAEHRAGRTPNPDVLCNAEIKFKAFLAHAHTLGAEAIATGHYARTAPAAGGGVALLKGLDPAKDQSYFLHRLTQAQLARAMFPVGALKKTAVRELAREIGLPNAAKKDSTGICFIGERPFRAFLAQWLEGTPGAIEDERGRVIGRHAGLSFYTLGQRQGLGIGGLKGRDEAGAGQHAPWFVAAKDRARNVLVAVQGHGHPRLLGRRLRAVDASWVAGHPPAATGPGAFGAKTRYRQADAAAAFEPRPGGGFALAFTEPQWAVTPGQHAVLYEGEVCLGGGVIDAAEAADGADASLDAPPDASAVTTGPPPAAAARDFVRASGRRAAQGPPPPRR
jgi:tRNA-specific 2-thiouridylase